MSRQVREIVIGGCTYLFITALRISLKWVPFDENHFEHSAGELQGS
jgi:hypothetical protein